LKVHKNNYNSEISGFGKTILVIIVFLNIFVLVNGQHSWDNGRLKASDNGHYLMHEDGTPFFYLGDTGWEMLHRLNREETAVYLENRKSKGFNVIQTVLISEFIHMDKTSNFYSDSIFTKENPDKPLITKGNNPENELEYDYWDHVDYAVKTAEDKGLYMALVATWGEWVTPRTDKPLFNTQSQAYNYGWFIGNRYRNSPNVIWILGGDRHPDERKEGITLWRSMAEGIADGTNNTKKMDGHADYSTTLMTHHSFNSSSTWFHNDEWIDFHTWGSYHAEVNNTRSYLAAISDWNLPNPKPTLNSEPCYEGHGINYAIPDNGVFTSTDVRLAAYWSVFSGAAGFTYGAQPIWQFTDQTRKKHSEMTFTDWQTGMDLPGAFQMAFLKKLFESQSMSGMVPDQSMIVSGQGDCANYVAAMRGKTNTCIYIPSGGKPVIKMGLLSGKKVTASWFNPRTGETTLIGEFENTGEKAFNVPGMSKELPWLRSGRGCDWVLILQDEIVLKPGGNVLMTGIIQKAVDQCASTGGGTVRLSAGTYKSGTIELKSNITIKLEKDVILYGSDKYEDYKNDAFFYGKDLTGVTIEGEGIIDGVDCYNPKGEEGFRGPHCIKLINCRNIKLEGITVKNSANWAINCRTCSQGIVTNVTIRGGHDGLHTRFCDNFTVKGCDFRTGDDAFAGNDNRDFDISACLVNTSCNGFRLGCMNLTVKHCTLWGPGESIHKIQKRNNMLSAFVHFSPEDEHPKLKSGNWTIEDITVRDVDVFFMYNYENGLWQTGQPVTTIKFREVKATGILSAFYIIGDLALKFNMSINQSSFIFREGAINSSETFEGAKLFSTDFFYAKNFNSIELRDITLGKKGTDRILTCTSGNSLSLENINFITGKSSIPYSFDKITKIKKHQLLLQPFEESTGINE